MSLVMIDRPNARRAWVMAAALGALTPSALALNPVAAYAEPSGPASFADIVDRVKGAVVSVKVKLADSGEEAAVEPHAFRHGPLERFFKRFGLPTPEDGPAPQERGGQGSGFFVSSDGYIVTNNHVVEHAREVTITTDSGAELKARVIGTDPKTDLALLKAEGSGFPTAPFARKPPRVGDWVIAVGNPFGLGGTVTAGIVSARGRQIGAGPYDDFIQIDAPVNHGNSGGPTFNNAGEVVGVNTAIFSPSGGSVGIGFAISSEVVESVVAQLKDHGAVSRGWLGVEIQPVTPDLAESLGVKPDTGALVAKEAGDSPAALAGVKVGDVIEAMNGDAITGPRDLARKVAAIGPKGVATLTLARDGRERKVEVTLGAMPSESAMALSAPGPMQVTPDLAGLTLQPVEGGMKVIAVATGTSERGLAPGDVIVDAGGKPALTRGDLVAALDEAKAAGRKSALLRVRSGQAFRFVALPVKPEG